MKTETLQLKYDAEKLSTLRLYMRKSQADLDGELAKCIDKLCERHIPKDVRELFEMRRQEQAGRPPRPPRSRPTVPQNPGEYGGQQE
ncbi:DUF6103 family protein [Ruminococcaceae bacterium OttesenSCG-928-L11]|nr:DUF6103 family protein [Ruminococcaceae bacterium OttesenSCG-928-L11]